MVVISASSSGKAYANQIANERNWGFTEVQSSDIDSVKSVIKNFYDKNHNNYLLIIGTNDEIPFAKPRTGYTEESSEIGSYDTDPSLYADVNNDGFIEMSVGRIPFSSDSELRTYFSDLAPKGGNYYFEHYNFAHDGNDSLDESTVRQFTYATCLKSITPSLSVYRQSGFADLVNHYKTATLLQVSAHGSNNLFAIDDPYNDFYINSLCADCRKLESASDPQCGCAAPQYLSNRPILIHLSCNNAKELGLQLIQNGASAFVGAYVQSGGTPPSMSESILSGMSVGDAFKNMYNGQIVSEATFNMEPGYNPTIVNIDGLNNFDFASLMMHSNPNCQILYGDPSLKLSSPPTSRQSIGIKKTPNQIIIDVSPAAMFDMTAKDSLLCYSSPYLQAPTFINKDYWGSGTNFGASHKIYLAIPVKGVNQIINTTAIVNNNELVLPNKKEGQIYYGEYRVNLVKGLSEGFLYLDINDPALDYNKNIKIMISYV